jgi:hypothetical protein
VVYVFFFIVSCVLFLRAVVKSATSGLNWAESTDQGTQEDLLKNAALQKALMQKSKFSDKEWASFGIKKLRSDHWMRVGESIWRPAAETAFDVKLLLARKFQLPRPDVRNDSKSRMLRLQVLCVCVLVLMRAGAFDDSCRTSCVACWAFDAGI